MRKMLDESQLWDEEHRERMMATAEYRYMDSVSVVAYQLLTVLDGAMGIMSPFPGEHERLRIARAIVAIEDAYNVATAWANDAREHAMNSMRFPDPSDPARLPSPDRRG